MKKRKLLSFEKRNKKNEVQYLIQIKNYDEYGRIIEEKFPVHSYSRTFEYVGGTMLVSPPSGEAGTKIQQTVEYLMTLDLNGNHISKEYTVNKAIC